MTRRKDKRPARKDRPGPNVPEPGSAPAAPPRAPAPAGNAGPAPPEPPPGLDEARHAAAQRAAHGAEVLHEVAFPSLMATALGWDKAFGAGAYRVYLANVMRDLGDPTDPLERLLVEQACLMHFRVAQLHASAGQVSGLEATKLLNTVAARMAGELRRTVLSFKAYRGTAAPTTSERARVKLFKAAQ